MHQFLPEKLWHHRVSAVWLYHYAYFLSAIIIKLNSQLKIGVNLISQALIKDLIIIKAASKNIHNSKQGGFWLFIKLGSLGPINSAFSDHSEDSNPSWYKKRFFHKHSVLICKSQYFIFFNCFSSSLVSLRVAILMTFFFSEVISLLYQAYYEQDACLFGS